MIIATMATTVQIDKIIKEELLVIKAQLEQQSGSKHTLNDAIRWLIGREQSLPFKERIDASKICFGSIKDLDISLEDLSLLRQERSSRLADF